MCIPVKIPFIHMYWLIETSSINMPAFSTSTSKHIPWEIPKNYRPISQCSRKWECIHPFIQNCIKNKWGLFWETHFAILLTNQQTNKQTQVKPLEVDLTPCKVRNIQKTSTTEGINHESIKVNLDRLSDSLESHWFQWMLLSATWS